MAFFANWDNDKGLIFRQINKNVEKIEEEQRLPPRQIFIKINPLEVTEQIFIKNFRE